MTATERPVAAPDAGPVDDLAPPDLGGRWGLPNWIPVPVAAGATYILLSLGVWWHVWTDHPATTTTCGCSDSSLFQWFLAWPAYAISHGLDPWYSIAHVLPARHQPPVEYGGGGCRGRARPCDLAVRSDHDVQRGHRLSPPPCPPSPCSCCCAAGWHGRRPPSSADCSTGSRRSSSSSSPTAISCCPWRPCPPFWCSVSTNCWPGSVAAR